MTKGQRSLSRWELASYAAPALPLTMVLLPLAVYLPAVYADPDGFGLELATVGFMLALSRVFDGITDPIIGYLSDSVRTRWGRRKPFLLIGTPIYMLGVWLLFVPSIEFSEVTFMGWTFNSGYPYLLMALVIAYTGATIKDVPYSAWGAELSSNYNERTLITSWREGFAVAGSLIGALTPIVVFFYGYNKPSDAVYFLAIFVMVMLPIFSINAVIQVPEFPVIESRSGRLPIFKSLKIAWNNAPYKRLLIIFLFSLMGSAMTNTLSFFFVKHVLLAGDLYGFYLAPYFVSQIIAIPLWFKLSRRIGKHRATMVAIGWYAFWSCFIPLIAISPQAWYSGFEITQILTFLPAETYESAVSYFAGIPTGKFLFFIIIMCLKGAAIGALSALPYAMAADVIDLAAAETGKRQAGAYFSIWLMTRKLAYAGGLVIGTSAAVYVGFNSQADPIASPNTAQSLLWLACLYSVVPAILKFVAVPLLWSYPLTEAKVLELQENMDSNIEAEPERV